MSSPSRPPEIYFHIHWPSALRTKALFQAKLDPVYLDNFIAKPELQLLHFFKPGVHPRLLPSIIIWHDIVLAMLRLYKLCCKDKTIFLTVLYTGSEYIKYI